MRMTVEPKTKEDIKIFIPYIDIKDKFGCIDEMFSDSIKSELNILKYKTPYGLSKEEYFEQICRAGLKERYGETLNDEIKERYNKEKLAIFETGKIDVFLYWYDIIQLAKNNNIMFGTGRGSAVGSLICYILGITNVDPVKYHLVFERFMSQRCIWFPDISIDIEEENSDILINLILEKYGSENVAIAVEPSYSPNIEDERAFQSFLFVTEKPIKDYVPVDKIAPNTYLTVQPYKFFNNSECLKFNFHFSKVLNRLKKTDINYNEIPLYDKNTFSLFQNAKTQGVYCYGKLRKEEIEYLKQLRPESIDDLTAFFALNRQSVVMQGLFDDFINAKNSKNKNKYSDLIEPILKETYGEIIYQEQIIQILNVIGSFSLSESDMIRRRMTKKNNDEKMLKYKKDFIENAQYKEIEYTKAKDLWDKMYQVSAYCFMKSHALSATLLSYYDAYIQVQKSASKKSL